jgi:phosphoserine phosphatase
MELKAIIFDLDETLMYEQRSVDETFLAVCAMAQTRQGVDAKALYASVLARAREIWHAAPMREYCVSVGVSSWEGLSGPFTSDNPNEQALAEWTPGYRLRAWAKGLADHGIDDPGLAEEMAAAFCVERERRHVLFDETMSVLDALRDKYRFAMLTNGAPSVQRAKIGATALAPYFEAIIVTGDVGVGKPDRRVFDLILDQLGLSAGEAVMVGDSLKNDIQGANNVDMPAVWLNRFGGRLNGQAEPDYELPDLTGLPGVLEQYAL